MSSRVYLALGANLGRRRETLQRAVNALGEFTAVEAISPIYETEPWGVVDQPAFLNLCLAARTQLSPAELLSAVKSIEKRLGREEGQRWGPRLIDIDIILFGDRIYEDSRITIPHPRFHERAFVLVPLADIASEMVDPGSGKTITQLLQAVDRSTASRLTAPEAGLRRPARLAWGIKTYVMGIINITPDSFSGDGLVGEDDLVRAAVNQAVAFVAEGADILDVGGESTRPGSVPVDAAEEIRRIGRVIQAIRSAVDVPISADTYKAQVAKAALAAGADWINDVWGLRMDAAMGRVAAEEDCPLILMHNRSKPKSVEQESRLGGRYVGIEYDDLIADVKGELQESVSLAIDQGVSSERIIVDPGIGFGKTVSQNLCLLDQLDEIKSMGYPVLLGSSRKSFIGYTLDLPPDQRLEGTAATVAIGIDRGADIVRVHDVRELVRVARMTDAIVRS
ncbi:MAG: dihydropteroate synthase [Chloroflexota bacterium]|jgi:dihydropteroate synthase/2-amino-4-hydroxy-6-hydroxymethyldihydropteridine diphosphokinase